jgi:hypothetical protein
MVSKESVVMDDMLTKGQRKELNKSLLIIVGITVFVYSIIILSSFIKKEITEPKDIDKYETCYQRE